ncbi:hypothetical protein, partial [Staphylococcus aureus]
LADMVTDWNANQAYVVGQGRTNMADFISNGGDPATTPHPYMATLMQNYSSVTDPTNTLTLSALLLQTFGDNKLGFA